MIRMETLIKHLERESLFFAAEKKLFKFKQVFDINDSKRLTFYVHEDEPTHVETILNDKLETINVCRRGDFVITGPMGEKYVVTPVKVIKLYNIVDGFMYTRKQHRIVAKVTAKIMRKLGFKNTISFKASWGEDMILEAGDYLVKDGVGYYRIESKAFTKTYVKVN